MRRATWPRAWSGSSTARSTNATCRCSSAAWTWPWRTRRSAARSLSSALDLAHVRHVADEVAVARVDRDFLPMLAEAVFASAGAVERHVRIADVAKDGSVRSFRFHTSK